jgi:hypothetical protein
MQVFDLVLAVRLPQPNFYLLLYVGAVCAKIISSESITILASDGTLDSMQVESCTCARGVSEPYGYLVATGAVRLVDFILHPLWIISFEALRWTAWVDSLYHFKQDSVISTLSKYSVGNYLHLLYPKYSTPFLQSPPNSDRPFVHKSSVGHRRCFHGETRRVSSSGSH